MKNRILTKLLALMITIIMCFSTVPALAISSPGITKFELDRSGLIESNGASLSDDKLVFEAGGSITFDVLLPFDTESIYFTYETITENTMFTIATDENSYTTWFAVGDVNTNKVVVTEVYGSNTITFTAAKAVTVTGVNFRKIDENYSETNSGDIPLTEYEYAVLTSVIFKNDASVVKTRGAIQNLNIENRRLSPMNIDGRLFVPFGKFAESLGYYAEDYPDKAYIYLTGETQSLALIKGKGYIESDKDGKRDFSLDVIYKSNMAWVPVRALSEALGFHVEYKEGFVVIDDRLSAKKVVEDEDIFTELKNEFNPHILAEEIKGNTYHVSQSEGASDSNAGTEKAPFKTLAKAATKANAGDTVIIHEGTYREKFRPRNDGTPSAPITFKAARGEKVVISALDKLSGFTAYQGKILKAQVTENLGFGRNQLFYKGEALNAGRHPNGDTKPGVVPYPKGVPEGVYATRGNIRITKEMNAGDKQAIAYSDTDLNYEENYWKGGTYVSLKGQGWSLVSGEITASKPGQLTVTDHAGSISYNLGLLPSALHGTHYYYEYNFPSDYAYITNHINTVDAEGEWFMAGDDNTMYVIPPANADPENDFEVKQRQLCIDLRGRKYITIEGIDTIGGGITMARETEGCVLNGGEFRYIAHHTILLDQSDYAMTAGETPSSKQSIKEGEAGICIDGKNNAIVNCKIDYSSATGVTLFGKYHYISNNTISNTSYSGGYPGGIWITPDSSKSADTLFGGHFITYNTVYNSGRSTLLMGSTIGGTAVGVAPVEIAYNRFFNGALSSRDTGVTYEYGFQGGNDKAKTRMHHNFVYNGGYKDADEGTKLMLIYHDGYVAARDTYCNVTYYEEEDKAPGREIYVQTAQVNGTNATVVRDRNNSTLGYLSGGEDDILRSDFPGGRRFEPGADHDQYPRSMDNYNEFKAGRTPYYPTTKSTDGKTYTFENIQIGEGVRTELALYLNRTVGTTGTFDVTAKAYNQAGTLVQTTKVRNTAETDRFYVYDLHKAEAYLEPMTAGTYKIELVFSDNTIDLRKMELESLDKKYDKLYTKEMEQAGVLAYLPTSSVESSGTETVTFENVAFRSGEKTLLDLNMTRDYDRDTFVTVTAEVYNASGTKVATEVLPNGISHSKNNGYEPLSAKVVIPELSASGNYKVVLTLSDTYSKAIRLVVKKADAVYDNLFNEDVIMGGSYDERYHPSGTTDVTKSATIKPETIANYTYYSAGNTWQNTLIYKNRKVSENAKYLRVTQASNADLCGSTVKVYVDNYNQYLPSLYTPILTWETFDTDWNIKTKYFELDSELTNGTHTFYFVFEGKSKCSTLMNFSFCNEAWEGETLDGING